MRIGILGGTFNPPHIGHLICAQEARVALGLQEVWLMPARVPPHKPVQAEPGPQRRLELCRLAAAGDAGLRACALEMQRDGPSYTVDTLQQLHESAPESEVYLILGGDVAVGLALWREPERVLALATPAIAKRRGTRRAAVAQALAALPGGQRAQFFAMPRVAISSTMVRRRVAEGRPIRYLVPDAVAEHIHRHGLYRGARR